MADRIVALFYARSTERQSPFLRHRFDGSGPRVWTGRAVLERSHPYTRRLSDPEFTLPESCSLADVTMLGVPLVRERTLPGVIRSAETKSAFHPQAD